MMNKKQQPRLGRGLDALLGSYEPAAEKDELRQLPLDLLRRGKYQPRTHMDPAALDELAASIKAQGVVQPIVVRALPSGEYEIVAGERRWRAAQLAGLESIPAVVRRIPDEAAIAIALIENIQRENLNPVEEANALQRLIDEFGMTHQQVAEAVGRSRETVSHLVRIRELDERVLAYLEDKTSGFAYGHARMLVGLPVETQIELANRVVKEKLHAKTLARIVRNSIPGKRKPNCIDADVERLEKGLSEHFGVQVRLSYNKKGEGDVHLHFDTLDILDGILAKFHFKLD